MIKKTMCIALLASLAALTACTSSDPEGERPEPVVTAPSDAPYMPEEDTPTADAAQSQAIISSLANVHPDLNHPSSVERARFVCEDIIAGKREPELLAKSKSTFEGATGELSEPQVVDILQVIKDSGFCK